MIQRSGVETTSQFCAENCEIYQVPITSRLVSQ